MSPTTRHLSDAALLALLNDEQQPAAQLSHLAVCPRCRERQAQLAAASRSFAQLYRSGAPLPPANEARARLQQNLRAATPKPLPRWSYAAATLLLAAGLASVLYRAHTVHAAEIIPNRQLTPGATQPVQLAALCNANDEDQDPAVAPDLRRAVLAEYGLNNAPASDYQIDYLINPQLGGTADLRNLWPEPYRAHSWNARAKDALETRLHQMVCTRQIDLDTAQRELATDWIAAYKKYFHSAQPLT